MALSKERVLKENKEIINLTNKTRLKTLEHETKMRLKLHCEKLLVKEEQQEKLKRKRKKEAEQRIKIASASMIASSGIIGSQLSENNGLFSLCDGGTHGIAIKKEVSNLFLPIFININ